MIEYINKEIILKEIEKMANYHYTTGEGEHAHQKCCRDFMRFINNVGGKKQDVAKPLWTSEDEAMLSTVLHKLEVCNLLSNKENVWIIRKLKGAV